MIRETHSIIDLPEPSSGKSLRTFYHFEELAKDQMGKIRRREVQEDLINRLEAEKNA